MAIGYISKRNFLAHRDEFDEFLKIHREVNPNISLNYKLRDAICITQNDFDAYLQRNSNHLFDELSDLKRLVISCIFNDRVSVEKSINKSSEVDALKNKRAYLLAIAIEHQSYDVAPTLINQLFGRNYPALIEPLFKALLSLKKSSDSGYNELLALIEDSIVAGNDIHHKLDILYYALLSCHSRYETNANKDALNVLCDVIYTLGDLTCNPRSLSQMSQTNITAKVFHAVFSSTFSHFYNSTESNRIQSGIDDMLAQLPFSSPQKNRHAYMTTAILNALDLLPPFALFQVTPFDDEKVILAKNSSHIVIEKMLSLKCHDLRVGLKAFDIWFRHYQIYDYRPDILHLFSFTQDDSPISNFFVERQDKLTGVVKKNIKTLADAMMAKVAIPDNKLRQAFIDHIHSFPLQETSNLRHQLIHKFTAVVQTLTLPTPAYSPEFWQYQVVEKDGKHQLKVPDVNKKPRIWF